MSSSLSSSSSSSNPHPQHHDLPSSFQKVIVKKLSSNFRDATEIITVETAEVIKNLKPGYILVRNEWIAINASDINYTNGKYLPGVKPPFDAGFEAVGTVVATTVPEKCPLGTTVAYNQYGAFTEYMSIPVHRVTSFPSNVKPNPSLIPLLVSGLTASLALEHTGELPLLSTNLQLHPTNPNRKEKQIVLVTAAAGATGSAAVQLAKLAGHHVIGTCSTDEKVRELKKLGVDRVINYKQEDIGKVLRSEYKQGVDVVYECVGGDVYNACVRNLARHGKCIIIGFISGYESGSGWKHSGDSKNIDVKPLILGKSASIRGFFVNDFSPHFQRHAKHLSELVQQGKLKVLIDPKKFIGLESVADALDYMYRGENVGKVVIKVRKDGQSKL